MIDLGGNTNYPFGTGAFCDLTGGVPQSASFFGQPGWQTVPTSWFTYTDTNGQIWVSPNANFSPPKYAAKINQDGCWVFYDMMARAREMAAARGDAVQASAPLQGQATQTIQLPPVTVVIEPNVLDGGTPAAGGTDNFDGGTP